MPGSADLSHHPFQHEIDELVACVMEGRETTIIDDAGYRGPLKPAQKSGFNYDLHPPLRDATKPAGAWNESRIVVTGDHIEHWLNGVNEATRHRAWTVPSLWTSTNASTRIWKTAQNAVSHNAHSLIVAE